MTLRRSRWSSRILLAGALGALVLGLVHPAPARARMLANAASSAKAAYREGRDEYERGNYAQAKKDFELAYKLQRTPAYLFNIAQCYRMLQMNRLAATTYRQFIRLDPTSPQLGLARELLKQVEQALGEGDSLEPPPSAQDELEPPLSAPSAKSDDLEPPPSAPRAKSDELEPPPSAPVHAVIATPLPPIIVAPPPAPPPRPPAPVAATTPRRAPTLAVTAPPPARKSKHIIAWTAGGAGAVALGTGLVFGLQSKSAQNELAGGMLTRTQADSDVSKVQQDSTVGNVLIIAGAALVVGAVVAWFVGAP